MDNDEQQPLDAFNPVSRADVDDIGLLPRRLDILTRDVRAVFDLLDRKVVPALERISSRLDQLDRADGTHEQRTNALEDRLSELALLVAVRG